MAARFLNLSTPQLQDKDADLVRRQHERAIQELQREVQRLKLGAGRWELIERKELKSASDTIGFSGLDGDSDEEYLIRGRMIDSTSTGGHYDLLLNGSNGTHSQYINGTNTTASAAATAGLVRVAFGTTATDVVTSFEGTLLARRGGFRIYDGLSGFWGATARAATLWSGYWNDTSTKIVSLAIKRTASTAAAGSWVELYRKRK